MTYITIALWVILIGFALEEFVLIKPVSTMAESDPFSRRLECAAIWLPAIPLVIPTAPLTTSGRILLVGVVHPGDQLQMDIELLQPIAMDQGLRFAIREGGRTVGSGVVTEIIE